MLMQASVANGTRLIKANRLARGPAKSDPVVRPAKDAALLNALTIIAHDLRGPLANLAVLIELMETYAQMQALDRVAAASLKAQAMIEGLSDLLNGFLQRTRETGDPLSFKSAVVDLGDVVQAAVELNQPIADNRGITIDTSDAKSQVLTGDKRLLIQAVENLVSNAVKHAPEGSTVTCEIAIKGRDAIVRVADEGQGLSELDLRRAFRPFSTLSSVYEGRTASWGLGLWIVRLIAERHGGRVDVTAQGPQSGAAFELRLPAFRL